MNSSLCLAPEPVREQPYLMAIDRPDQAPDLGPPAADGRPPPERIVPERVVPERAGPERAGPERHGPERDGPSPDQRSRTETYADLRAADPPPAADAAHTTADGGWSWKSLRLTRADNQVADQQLAARRQAEGRHPDGTYDDRGLTPALRRVEGQLDHGTLVPDTEKFALKSPNRFKEKLAKMMGAEPDRPASDLAGEIHDGIRYTYVLGFELYSSDVDKARQLLRAEGYESVAFKPSWAGDEYKGINSQWRDPASGQFFEVQFHTQDSWEAKQKTHAAYEKIESPETAAADRVKLREYQRDITAQVPVPPGALDFVPSKQKGK
jgi:hypothetical protein